jgi:hypothetical protein
MPELARAPLSPRALVFVIERRSEGMMRVVNLVHKSAMVS